jgi:hypothetical protein
MRIRGSLEVRNDLTERPMGRPGAFDLAVTPRWYGVVGHEMNLYLSCLHTALGQKLYEVTDTSALGGKLLNECYRITPAGAGTGTVTVSVLDPNSFETLDSGAYALKVTAANAAAAAARRVLCIGDSTTSAGDFTQEILDLVAAEVNAVQITLAGTVGAGANLHEGVSGFSMANFFEPSDAGQVTSNNFVTTLGTKFNAAAWVDGTAHASGAQAAPDIVVWHLGINDVANLDTDAQVHTVMDSFIASLDRMIGLVEDATVGSWADVDPGIANVVCVPIPPAATQDAFGDDYGVSIYRHRYWRNICIASHRLIDYYDGYEGSGIFLCPWNASVDPVHGFAYDAAAPANAHTALTVERQNNGVHPDASAEGGYQQMGAALWAFINGLVVDTLA